MLVFGLLFLRVFGSESGCLGFEQSEFGMKVEQKTIFAEVGIFMMPGRIFLILRGIATHFHSSGGLGDRLEI